MLRIEGQQFRVFDQSRIVIALSCVQKSALGIRDGDPGIGVGVSFLFTLNGGLASQRVYSILHRECKLESR